MNFMLGRHSFVGNFIKWFTGQFLNVVTMAMEIYARMFAISSTSSVIFGTQTLQAMQGIACFQVSLFLPGQLSYHSNNVYG